VCQPKSETAEFLPTRAMPGTDEKVEVMAGRYRDGLPLHHPEDATAESGEAALITPSHTEYDMWPGIKCVNPREVPVSLSPELADFVKHEDSIAGPPFREPWLEFKRGNRWFWHWIKSSKRK